MCVDYNQKELNKLKEQYVNKSRIYFYILDITSIDQIKDVAKTIRQEVGDVTLLINNAGTVNQGKLLLDLTEQEITRLFQVLSKSFFYKISNIIV